MKLEEIKNAISVMQAYLNGKDIEYKSINKKCWIRMGMIGGTPVFNFGNTQYRIKKDHKPFDSKNKNIQWVRYLDNQEEVHAVQKLEKGRISYISSTSKILYIEEKEYENWEWSECNKIWNEFYEKIQNPISA